MWILILFAIIALVLFLIMIALKQDVLVSIVVSVLAGLILAYYLNHLTITFDKPKDKDSKDNKDKDVVHASNTLPHANQVTSVQSNTNSNSNSSSFDFFNSLTH